MTIDWASVVGEALCEGSVGMSDFVCPRSTSGNKPTPVGTSGATQGIDNAKNDEACSHFPTVPTACEEDLGCTSYRAPETPDGGSVKKLLRQAKGASNVVAEPAHISAGQVCRTATAGGSAPICRRPMALGIRFADCPPTAAPAAMPGLQSGGPYGQRCKRVRRGMRLG